MHGSFLVFLFNEYKELVAYTHEPMHDSQRVT